MPKLNETVVATTIKNLNVNKVKVLQFLIPDQKILEKFNLICEDIQIKIEKLTKKIENSERIRDKLLDKLFSQKVKISL
ncbi:restriction endonuclease subunit S [Mycoplasma suis]|uniref:restriction endonuclease subunit S n=1 Tax=Mycoplasma suis TaxID=57372 RepID=UPI0002F8C5CE|nr:restriction endonuclease subunit S [Mycoplasma suis]